MAIKKCKTFGFLCVATLAGTELELEYSMITKYSAKTYGSELFQVSLYNSVQESSLLLI